MPSGSGHLDNDQPSAWLRPSLAPSGAAIKKTVAIDVKASSSCPISPGWKDVMMTKVGGSVQELKVLGRVSGGVCARSRSMLYRDGQARRPCPPKWPLDNEHCPFICPKPSAGEGFEFEETQYPVGDALRKLRTETSRYRLRRLQPLGRRGQWRKAVSG